MRWGTVSAPDNQVHSINGDDIDNNIDKDKKTAEA
jgi:hypothetical protein